MVQVRSAQLQNAVKQLAAHLNDLGRRLVGLLVPYQVCRFLVQAYARDLVFGFDCLVMYHFQGGLGNG